MSCGFTLPEILAALAVLVIGLTAVLGLFMGSLRQSTVSSDRVASMILISEAARQIELEHLLTADIKFPSPADKVPDYDVGLYIETLNQSPQGDTQLLYKQVVVFPIGDPPASDPSLSNAVYIKTPPKPTPNQGNLGVWPHFPDNPRKVSGAPYRVVYRLEKHPEWWPHTSDGDYTGYEEIVNSPFRGIYLLTMVCYKTPGFDMTISSFQDKIGEWEQVSEPVMVLLRDRKIR